MVHTVLYYKTKMENMQHIIHILEISMEIM